MRNQTLLVIGGTYTSHVLYFLFDSGEHDLTLCSTDCLVDALKDDSVIATFPVGLDTLGVGRWVSMLPLVHWIIIAWKHIYPDLLALWIHKKLSLTQ